MTVADVALRVARTADVPAMLALIHEAFAAREPLDPPAEALRDTAEDVEAALAVPGFGVIAEIDGAMAGCLLVRHLDPAAGANPPSARAFLRRVAVRPDLRHLGVAALMVRQTAFALADEGVRHLELLARPELPRLVAWWGMHGFAVERTVPHGLIMGIALPRPVAVATAEDMRALGRRLAARLRPGDLLVANGELGAGKTTLAQGLAEGLRVDRPVLSPTFVLARQHPSLVGGPALVHVDAYRLGSAAELDDLDLDATAEEAVTYVEWGAGLAEHLAPSRLDIEIARADDPDDATRTVYVTGLGPRWAGIDLALAGEATEEGAHGTH